MAGTYRLPLGNALCGTLVEGAGAKGRWLQGASGCRNSARIGRKSNPSESVSALHVRLRSEEHTSELQSLAYLVCRLLLEKKNNSAGPVPRQWREPEKGRRTR